MFTSYLQETLRTLERLGDAALNDTLLGMITTIVGALRQDAPVLVFGNGGSAADAQHITAELAGRFMRERKGLRVHCLASNVAFLTAWTNDYDYASVFERQIEAYGAPGGVAWGLSTSGTSKNVIQALKKAKSMGMHTLGMTGESGGKMEGICDFTLKVPSTSTPHIQEGHITLYHYMCQEIENLMITPGI